MKNAEYVGAICSSREKYLISSAKFEKMLTMSLGDALKLIKDGGFGKGEELLDAEKLISAEEENFINFIKEYAPSQNFINYKLLSYDYQNANGLLRAINLNLPKQRLTTREGRYSVESLTTFIETGEGDIDSAFLKTAIIEGKKLFASGKATGVLLDTLFLKAKYQESLALVKRIKPLKNFVMAEIDALNISTALRSSSVEFVEKAFIDGGNLTKTEILNLNELSKIPESIKGTEFGKVVEKAVANVKEGKALVEFENYAQSYPLKTLMVDKYVVEGFNIFYLYCAYKENEIRNVRILTVGLSAGLDKQDIKARLRLNYAG